MSTPQPLSTAHADLITSLSFSLSSPSLLASSSLDGYVRVHARLTIPAAPAANGSAQTSQRRGQHHRNDDDETAEDDSAISEHDEAQDRWVEVGSCKANEGPVWRVIWGPREYGTSILVSISGSVVHIWETQLLHHDKPQLTIKLRATLVEARGSMRDIDFSPSEFGVKLAAVAADSHLRIYECLDPSASGLSTWSLLEDVEVASLPAGFYTPSAAAATMASSTQEQTQLIKGFESSGQSKDDLGTARGNGHIESSGAWAVSYCSDAYWGENVAVSAGKDGSMRILHFVPPSYWSQLLVLAPSGTSTAPISTIAWAPTCGRSYHLIASGARNGCVRIWKVTPSNESGQLWEGSLAAEITEHMNGGTGGIGRVEWNITGTILSTAGCDGIVRLWKALPRGEWRIHSTISCDDEDEFSQTT